MNPVITDGRHGQRGNREPENDGAVGDGMGAQQLAGCLGREHAVEGVEANVGDQRYHPDQERAEVAKLRARLDELREPQLRTLGGMKGHEERAERAAAHYRDGRPQHRLAQGHADHADRKRRQVGFAGKPHRPQIAHLAVPLSVRHIVDRATFKFESMRHVAPPKQSCR